MTEDAMKVHRVKHAAFRLLVVGMIAATSITAYHFWWRHKMHPIWVARRKAFKAAKMDASIALPKEIPNIGAGAAGGVMGAIVPKKTVPERPSVEGSEKLGAIPPQGAMDERRETVDWTNVLLDTEEKGMPVVMILVTYWVDKKRRGWKQGQDDRQEARETQAVP